MKHPQKTILIIIAMFLVAQLIGLAVMTSYDSFFGKSSEEKIKAGEFVQPEFSVVKETVPPEVKIKEPVDVARIVISIILALLIATALFFFLLKKIRVTILIKIWFTVVIFICLTLAFALILYPYLSASLFSIFGKKIALAEIIAIPLAAILTFYKIVKRNILVHNFTELFIYPGLAVIFLPILNILAAAILLILISIYDMWAVWKSKYMIKLAKFQINHLKIFTGFFIPYVNAKDKAKIQKMKAMEKRKKEKKGKKGKLKKIKINVQIAALGGGDIAFPLIFAGTILLTYGLAASVITILCTTLALLTLLGFSEKGKFYPAMPFLSAGCFAGLALVMLFLI